MSQLPNDLHSYRKDVDKAYVGFQPNGNSIKPVHIAGGALRTVYGAYNRSMSVKQMALVADSKGNPPKDNKGNPLKSSETDYILKQLRENELIEEDVTKESLDSLRSIMQKLLSADKGVYVLKGLADGMLSYSAGSKYFLAGHAMYEDAGEFMGSVLKEYCPELASYIKQLLEDAQDPISILFEPILEEDMESFEGIAVTDIPAFKNPGPAMEWFIAGLRDSSNCLLNNLKQHPNQLTQIRLINLYCIFQIVRYMMLLESFYCEAPIRPILLDFSGASPTQSSIARASEMAYTQLYKSLNRFYAWCYACKLEGLDKDELLQCDVPQYDAKKANKEELGTLWTMAKERAALTEGRDDEIRLIFGEAMYDILALEASSHPVNYLKALGTASGLLYPPDPQHPHKRFVVSQDILEMLLRCLVNPNEVLSRVELRERLWNRFGIIIGGSPFEMDKLQKSGMLLQIDEDALEGNFDSFASTLEAMDFAEVMADGILQIRLGGIN